MFCRIFVTMLFAAPVAAETYLSDAFGIVPEAALSAERTAWAGLRDGTTQQRVTADDADAVLIFVGPKALVAGKDEGHAVALSFDRYGNLAQDAQVSFLLESNDMLDTPLQDGIGDVLFVPEPRSGTFSAGARVNSLQSTRALYRVTADLDSVAVAVDGAPAIRAETFTTLASGTLSDQFGNFVEDGTGATSLLSHDDGSGTLLFAPVREAKAEAIALGRDMSMGGTVTFQIGSAMGGGSFIYDSPAAAEPPKLWLWGVDDIGAVGLRLGPVTTDEGYLLTDGSPVEVQVSGTDGSAVSATGWIRDGYFETLLRRPAKDDTLTVRFATALGAEERQVVVDDAAPLAIRGAE